MVSVNKNKSKRGKSQSSRNGKMGKRESAATRSARPVIVTTRDELVPDDISTTLIYSDHFQITTGGTYVSQQWKLNSAYDPDYTNAGAQPSGYDQLAAFYGYYKVYKVEVELDVVPSSAPVSFALYPSPNVTIATSFGAAAAQPHSLWGTTSVYEKVKFKKTYDIAKHLGVDSAEFADVVYGADISTNPVRLLYLTLFALNVTGSATTIYIGFKMKMHLQFQQRTYLGLSLMSPSCKVTPEDQKALQKELTDLKGGFLKLIKDFEKL